MLTVARASRNSILAAYRRWRVPALALLLHFEKQWRKVRTLNVRALAIQQQPEMFRCAKGRMAWQPEGLPGSSREIVHEGDEEALKAYIAIHHDELEAEKNRRKSRMPAFRKGCSDGVPLTNEAWLTFLEDPDCDAEFRALMTTATAARRASCNGRLLPRSGLQQVERFEPRERTVLNCEWIEKIKRTRSKLFFLIHDRADDRRSLICASTVATNSWGFSLPQARGRNGDVTFLFDVRTFIDACRSLEDLVSHLGFADDSEPAVCHAVAISWVDFTEKPYISQIIISSNFVFS